MNKSHTYTHDFHIPVMGIGFTIDTPFKVAHWGIDSVISMVDDMLVEKLRAHYSKLYNKEYSAISRNDVNHRAARFTAYLNLMKTLVGERFEQLKQAMAEGKQELQQYIDMLPDRSELKTKLVDFVASSPTVSEFKAFLDAHLRTGSIDTNIMTKLDKSNRKGGEVLPDEYNDAHAALRGFAESDLEANIVLSAGMNPRLYSYLGNFADFKPNAEGNLRKKLILKVSDYRSALIQGKFLAKKGIWVSEYRIESGLNCGGHAFATDGVLIGPILQEFKDKRSELYDGVMEVLRPALEAEGIEVPQLVMRVTAQGGVGTHEEHQFLLDYYGMDSVGWGTPFLLAPDVCNVDEPTRERLIRAREEDLYLSGISPLGVPFNSLRGNSKSLEWQARIDAGTPGSLCPKRYVTLHDVEGKAMCIASTEYQMKKLAEVETSDLTVREKEKARTRIIDRDCICVGLGTAALIVNQLDTKVEGPGVSICPGPNMAYYNKETNLHEMIAHIYGRTSVLSLPRPNMYVKELSLYYDYFFGPVTPNRFDSNTDSKKLEKVRKTILQGIEYYKALFAEFPEKFGQGLEAILAFEAQLQPINVVAV